MLISQVIMAFKCKELIIYYFKKMKVFLILEGNFLQIHLNFIIYYCLSLTKVNEINAFLETPINYY